MSKDNMMNKEFYIDLKHKKKAYKMEKSQIIKDTHTHTHTT